MNAIIGYSEMLVEEAEGLNQPEFIPDLKKINAAGHQLLALINDILDLSKIEAGKMELYLETFDVAALIQDVATTIQPLVQKNSNVLQVGCAADVGLMKADLTKVRQSLFNLLSNACKFTRQGTVTLNAARRQMTTGERIVFQVCDSGIGMTRAQLEKLFQPFTQADSSTTRQFGGTGLGLSITRRFCEMMGGSISVESEVGQGTTFTLTLPGEVADGKPQAEPVPVTESASSLDGGTLVLVIDDDPSVRDLMQRFLRKEGYRVVCAADGEEGLRLARELHPSIITLDVMMPRQDGWSVLAALKADREISSIPVLMLTVVDDRNLGFALGATEYMTKPIDPDRLAAILRKYRRPQAWSVLVVEDDAPAREVVHRLLEKEGWGVVEAVNGRVALDLVARKKPDLILLDLLMPEMDGFEFVEQLRHTADWQCIPVVVLTAKDITDEERLRLDGYVRKVLQKGAGNHAELLREVRTAVAACLPHKG